MNLIIGLNGETVQPPVVKEPEPGQGHVQVHKYECIGEDSETVTCPNNPTCTTIHLENIQAFQECTDDPSVVNCKLLTKNGYCSKDEL